MHIRLQSQFYQSDAGWGIFEHFGTYELWRVNLAHKHDIDDFTSAYNRRPVERQVVDIHEGDELLFGPDRRRSMHYDYFFALSRREREFKRLHECLTPGIFYEPAVKFHVRVEHVSTLELAGQVEQLDLEVFKNAARYIFTMLGDLLE